MKAKDQIRMTVRDYETEIAALHVTEENLRTSLRDCQTEIAALQITEENLLLRLEEATKGYSK